MIARKIINREKKYKKNNQGFTLVELIVTLAIVGIISISVVSFMVTGINSYEKTSQDVNLQYETQLTMNQIQDLIIDAGRGVTYEVLYDDGTTESLTDDSTVVEDAVSAKTLTIYNQTTAYKIIWNKGHKKLYYSQYNVDLTGSEAVLVLVTDSVLMADYISAFSMDLNLLNSDRIARIDLELSMGSKTYRTFSNVTLRNQVLVNLETDKVYEGIYAGGGDGTKADSVKVSPESILLWPGQSQTFQAVVSSIGGGYPSQNVLWSITGANDSGTRIENGILTLSANETAASLTIEAQAMDVEEGMIVKDTSSVYIKQVSGITISSENSNEEGLYRGGHLQLQALVSGEHVESNNWYDQEVIWSLAEGSDAYASISSTGLLTIKDTIIEEDKVITVRAVSARNVTISAMKNYTIKMEEPTLTLQEKGNTSAHLEISRGERITLEAVIGGVSDTSGYDLDWSYVLYDENDKEVPNPSGGNHVTGSINNRELELRLDSSLAYSNPYYIRVEAKLSRSGIVLVTRTVDIAVPEVKVTFSKSADGSFSDVLAIDVDRNYVYYRWVVIRYETNYSTKVYYKVEGLENYNKIDWEESVYNQERLSISEGTEGSHKILIIKDKIDSWNQYDPVIIPKIDGRSTNSRINIKVR